MAQLTHIDVTRPLSFRGHVTRPTTEPFLREAAQSMNLPGLLQSIHPVDAAEVEVAPPHTAGALAWLQAHPQWGAQLEEHLQCVCEDQNGHPILTTLDGYVLEDLRHRY
jgi:hypothetical protein